MFDQFTIIFGKQWHTYTIALIFGIVLSFAWMLFRSTPENRGRVFDVCLAALIGGILLGRLVHVGLNWVFFTDNLDLIWQIHKEGGLNWQAAVLGALTFGYGMAKLRELEIAKFMSDAVLLLPFLAFISCYACATAACAYGLPVERMSAYPDFLTWIADDIYRLNMPRFATQPLGMMSSLALLLLAIIFYWRAWLPKIRFWLILLLLCIASFGIGFLRGDYALMWFGLRAGQVLDIGMMVFSALLIIIAVFKTNTIANYVLS